MMFCHTRDSPDDWNSRRVKLGARFLHPRLEPNFFIRLPQELLLYIISYYNQIDVFVQLNRLRLTCRAYRYLLHDYEPLWTSFNNRFLGKPVPLANWPVVRDNIITYYPQRSRVVAVEQDWLKYFADDPFNYEEHCTQFLFHAVSTAMVDLIFDVLKKLIIAKSLEFQEIAHSLRLSALSDATFTKSQDVVDYIVNMCKKEFTDRESKGYIIAMTNDLSFSLHHQTILPCMDKKNNMRTRDIIELFEYNSNRVNVAMAKDLTNLLPPYLTILSNYSLCDIYYSLVILKSANLQAIVCTMLKDRIRSQGMDIVLKDLFTKVSIDETRSLAIGKRNINIALANQFRDAFDAVIDDKLAVVQYYHDNEGILTYNLRYALLFLPLLLRYVNDYDDKTTLITQLLTRLISSNRIMKTLTYRDNKTTLLDSREDSDHGWYQQSDSEELKYELHFTQLLHEYAIAHEIAIPHCYNLPLTISAVYLSNPFAEFEYVVMTEDVQYYNAPWVKITTKPYCPVKGFRYRIEAEDCYIIVICVDTVDLNEFSAIKPHNAMAVTTDGDGAVNIVIRTNLRDKRQFKEMYPTCTAYY